MNPERLLGALMKQGLRSKGRKSAVSGLLKPGWKGAAGLGALGVAIAAFEHFTGKEKAPGGRRVALRETPPAPPGRRGDSTSPPPPPVADASKESQSRLGEETSLLLIRAMILAAHADGQIDEDEKARILARIQDAGLSQDELALLESEMDSPVSMSGLLAQVKNEELAQQVYLVSCLAIELDTEAERNYLAFLRSRLGIDDAAAREIHQEIENDQE